MRRTTLLWLALAVICGAVLFHTSQQVNDGQARLATLDDDIRKENETIRVLEAEWSYLNKPDRLEKLAKQYLDLAPLTGRQFTKVSDIADRTEESIGSSMPEAKTPDTEEKPAEAATEKPAPAKSTAAAAVPVVKFRPALSAPAPQKHAAPVSAERAPPARNFGDLMKSLGVH